MRKLLAAAGAMVSLAVSPGMTAANAEQAGRAFDHRFTSIDGSPLPLADFRGKALLVVNTASFCGFTNQYAGLQQLWTSYEARGLVVIGVPSNDFGEQEPKAEGEIKTFCTGAFGVTFPLTSKEVVSGSAAHPFYRWASTAAPGAGPKWNFHKYLVGRDGRLIAGFGTTVKPDAPQLIRAIEAALAVPAPASQ
jgi:glutathione peroxidase